MKDALGDRIKDQYENRTRYLLPRRTYTIIRVDGKAFHSFTRNCKKPFDKDLMRLMDNTAIELCKEMQGAKVAFVQSDEISVLLTDFESPQTCAWFDGNLQKISSVSASMATMYFNHLLSYDVTSDVVRERFKDDPTALFDGRAFTIADPTEVENYFIWRQADATRNSLQMAARAVYSHKELEGKQSPELHEMLHASGLNWNNYTSGEKRGRAIVKETYQMPVVGQSSPHTEEIVTRTRWISCDGFLREGTPIFTQDRDFLQSRIPKYNQEKE